MTSNQEILFSRSALPTNQSGRLTDEQSRRWTQIAKDRRRSVRGVALPFAAIGALLLLVSGPAAKAAARTNAGVAFLATAAILVVVASLEPLNADVRQGRVESVDGAIAKRSRYQSRARQRTYYFYVGGRRLQALSRLSYDAAPDAGYVRAYFLPRSGRVVNLEQLADPPIPTGSGAAQEIVQDYARALGSLDRTKIAEASAGVMALKHVVEGPAAHTTADGRDGLLPLNADDLYGTWANPIMTVAFSRNGIVTLTTAIGGITREGRWSVDANGRLLTDATGALEPMEASLKGRQLTVTIEGQQVTFTRSS